MKESNTNNNLPLVSVIIPAYNAAKFIAETIESVLSQIYQNIEIVVVDDGSQDETSTIVRQFAARDRRVRLIQQANAGVAAARNCAIQNSQGEFIVPIDADDIWYPQKIDKQV
jgi:glycosyltransferase involved in cell wall biosynthesis